MDAGWAWQIEHEHWINRGYVYSSRFISDDAARAELLAKNPKIANEPRIVKFRSGRLRRSWVGNVVAIGNAAGFVEPLEATALQVICVQSRAVADALIDGEQRPTQSAIAIYNELNGYGWDDIRDFLAIHYAFNTRLDTPFWRACRDETDIGGAARLVEYYRENGPSTLGSPFLLRATNSFGIDGYLALLCGQQVPHQRPYNPTPPEAKAWEARTKLLAAEAQRGFGVKEALAAIRGPKWKWP
jgi:tryptophan halogenase